MVIAGAGSGTESATNLSALSVTQRLKRGPSRMRDTARPALARLTLDSQLSQRPPPAEGRIRRTHDTLTSCVTGAMRKVTLQPIATSRRPRGTKPRGKVLEKGGRARGRDSHRMMANGPTATTTKEFACAASSSRASVSRAIPVSFLMGSARGNDKRLMRRSAPSWRGKGFPAQ